MRSTLGIGESARIGELPRRLLDLRAIANVLLGRDDHHDQLFAEDGLAEDVERLDARRGAVEHAEVRRHLPVVGQRLVGADVHLQMLRRRGDLRGLRERMPG
jgi:hypothetical protein